MEQQVYHCLRYRGLAPLSCSDEFACHDVVMNGRKDGGNVLWAHWRWQGEVWPGSLPQARTSPQLWPPTDVQVYVHISAASSSVGWPVCNTTQHQFDICFDKESDSMCVSMFLDPAECPLLLFHLYERVCLKVRHSLTIYTGFQLKSNTLDLIVDNNLLKLSSVKLNLY